MLPILTSILSYLIHFCTKHQHSIKPNFLSNRNSIFLLNLNLLHVLPIITSILGLLVQFTSKIDTSDTVLVQHLSSRTKALEASRLSLQIPNKRKRCLVISSPQLLIKLREVSQPQGLVFSELGFSLARIDSSDSKRSETRSKEW